MQEALLAQIARRTVRVGVIGLGYVGLPLAVCFAEAGFAVTGFDIHAGRVAQLGHGQSYIGDVPDAALHAIADRFSATTDFDRLADQDAIILCVPTPLLKTRDPDMSHVVQAAEQVAERLRPGQVIVLESTTYPGATREVLLPLFEARGLQVGHDFFLAYSPERVDPSRTDWTIATTPKVMGGVTAACLQVASALYGAALQRLVPVSNPETAEMVKLLENTFRAVNIGLANELLLMCDALGLDAWEVIDAASTKPFGFMKFTPGPGLGGHCIPVDPLYLSWKLKSLNYNARFIDLASEINTAMPHYWVQRVQDALNDAGRPLKGSRVLVLGVAYKREVSDLRESPALDILLLLRQKGAEVHYHDPFVPTLRHGDLDLASVPDLPAAVRAADAVLLATDHAAYDAAALAAEAAVWVNTRGSRTPRHSPSPASHVLPLTA